jgi:PAS domain S-box-containing protein
LAVFRQGIILNENENLYLAAKKEIESRKKSEEALKLANIYNRSLIEVNLDPLVTIGLDGKITDVNSSTETVTGYSRHELIGTDFSSYFTEHDKAQEGYKKTFQNGSVRNYPLEIQNKNGKSVPVLYNATTYKNESGEIIGVFAAARDINELKKAEDKLKASLNEKELLLKEIHHRVKNNMQIISSLLSLQSKYIEDNSTIQILKESEVRIKAMSLVHEAIYLSDNLSSIPFQSYIQRLVMDIIIHYNTQWITPKFNIEDINFNIETAIPCGLIITEIVTNSIKYAFLNNEGVISVEFTREMDKLKLTVSDNGRGLPEHLLHEKSNSLGLLLVEMLVNQLEGELKIDNRNGTTFTIIFKELEYAERV